MKTEVFPRQSGHSRGQLVFVHLFYIAVTVVVTYPVILSIHDQVPAISQLANFLEGDSDVWLFIWNLWWFDHGLRSETLSVMKTSFLFYPHDISLLFHSYSFMNGLFGYVLAYLISSKVIIYNILFLLSFYLSGLTSFHLFSTVTRDWRAGLVGSLVFTLGPFHVMHSLAHLNLMSVQWLPLGVLYFFRFRAEGRVRHFLAGMALFTINFFSCFYFAVLLLFFFPVYILSDWLNPWASASRTWRDFERSGIFMIGLIVVLIGLVLPVWLTAADADYSGFNPSEMSVYSADFCSFLVSNPLHPLWGETSRKYLESLPGNIIEKSVSGGIIPHIMLIAALFIVPWRRLFPWLSCMVVFIVLSWGPYLVVNGQKVSIGGKPLYLPFYLFTTVDFLNNFRVPARFAVIAGLCLAAINALTVMAISQKWQGPAEIGSGERRRSNISVVLLTVLLLMEFWSAPLPTLEARVPEVYQAIGQEEEDFVVLDVPLDCTVRKYQYYQTIHRHPLLMAFVARFPTALLVRVYWDPVLKYFTVYNQKQPFERPSHHDFWQTMGREKVKYLIIHRAYLSPERLTDMLSFLTPFRHTIMFDKQDLIVFRFDHSDQATAVD